jgi:7,8-dihydroneopterin aldolase/epimerase/oxygenase
MTDRIILRDMRFTGTHGYHEWERRQTQPFEVDVELVLDLAPAGTTDDLEHTIDYGRVYDLVRSVVEDRTYRLLEAIGEAIAADLLTAFEVDEVVVRVRKPAVQLGGPLEYAGVEIHRRATPDPG